MTMNSRRSALIEGLHLWRKPWKNTSREQQIDKYDSEMISQLFLYLWLNRYSLNEQKRLFLIPTLERRCIERISPSDRELCSPRCCRSARVRRFLRSGGSLREKTRCSDHPPAPPRPTPASFSSSSASSGHRIELSSAGTRPAGREQTQTHAYERQQSHTERERVRENYPQ